MIACQQRVRHVVGGLCGTHSLCSRRLRRQIAFAEDVEAVLEQSNRLLSALSVGATASHSTGSPSA
jgi:hypothetical protein